MKKEPDIRMIDVEALIEILTMLWNKGIDYVDIRGSKGEISDSVTFSFSKEYISEDHKDEYDDMFVNEDPSKENITTIKLTDENINDLL